MNTKIADNLSKVKWSFLIPALLVLFGIFCLFYAKGALTADAYVEFQKDYFFLINSKLSKCPNLQYNLTQIGDALIFLSALSIFFLYAPKIWESLLSASLISLIFSGILKEFIDVPRPATIFDNDSFAIIGKLAIGYSSLPSGHSITIFTTLTVLLFAFMPKLLKYKILYITCFLVMGFIFAFTRVGVGAHHPLDVIIGCSIGYIAAVLGIISSRRFPIWNWISNRKFYPIFIIGFSICAILLIHQIMEENLIIFYISLLCLLISLYLITKAYVKKIE